MSDRSFPEHIDDIVRFHYSDIIKNCHENYKAYPDKITQIRNITSKLACLAKGTAQLSSKYLDNVYPNYSLDDIELLGQLCRKEIYETYSENQDLYKLEHFELEHIEMDDYIIEAVGETESEVW